MLVAIILFSIVSVLSITGQKTDVQNYSCGQRDFEFKFTLSLSSHSAWNLESECSLPVCGVVSNTNNCRSSTTPCFNYQTSMNQTFCAPGILCSLLEPCNNDTYTCSSGTFICIIRSCCKPQAVCVPSSVKDFCLLDWIDAGKMNQPRYGHTSSVLKDGKVLVTGGSSINDSLNSTELYDPITGIWQISGSMRNTRIWHTETVLEDGKVLVTGGINNDIYLNTSELYDPIKMTWSNTGNMNNRRRLHTASMLSDGKVLVCGGTVTSSINPELYDPSMRIWTNTSNMINEREYHTASILLDGQVLVTGGMSINSSTTQTSYQIVATRIETNGLNSTQNNSIFSTLSSSNVILDTAELYDPLTEKWSTTGNMNIARYGHSASVLLNGKVLIAGGLQNDTFLNSAELYDPSTRKWTTTGSMQYGRYDHRASLLKDGNVLVTGGGVGKSLYTAELYNPLTQTWMLTSNMNTRRIWHSASVLSNGKVLVAGGSNNTLTVSTAQLY